MRVPLFSSTIVNPLLFIAVVFLYGCASSSDSAGKRTNPSGSGPSKFNAGPLAQKSPSVGTIVVPASSDTTAGGEPVSTFLDARPAALINGRTLNWTELRPILNELGGAEALQEIILDRKLREALINASITITPDDVAAERKMLLESLNDDPNVSIRLLDELRDRQKLGKVRFEALMQRNAGLRALIRSQVAIKEDAIEIMYEMMHGPKRQARIMILPDLLNARSAINLVNSGASFSDVAVEMSTDSSASRGGLLEPISRTDPAYPEALRQTLWSLNPGEMSGPILIDDHYAVLLMVKRIAGDGISLEEARPSVERMVGITQERLLMDQMARRLMSDTTVNVFDDSLNESWLRRTRKNP